MMPSESFSAASDLHGDRSDPTAVAGFKRFVAEFKPKHRWFLGDLWDFRALRMGADREEKMHSMREDFRVGMEFVEWYKPQILLLGNHDQRLWDAVEKDGLHKTGPIADLATDLIGKFETLTQKLAIRVLPYNKRTGVANFNGLKLVHGFDGMDPQNMASVFDNVLYGHGHRIETATAPHQESKIARMIGCLAQKDMTYNRAQLRALSQQHGWAYGSYLGRKKFGILQAELVDKTFTYASKMTTINL